MRPTVSLIDYSFYHLLTTPNVINYKSDNVFTLQGYASDLYWLNLHMKRTSSVFYVVRLPSMPHNRSVLFGDEDWPTTLGVLRRSLIQALAETALLTSVISL